VDIFNDAAGDSKFSTLFNANAGGQRFTAGFFGRLTAPENGVYQFQANNVDDNAGFWVDLNRDGVFESNGSIRTTGSFRFRNERGEELEVKVPLPSGVKVVLRKKDSGGAWREQGEGGVSWSWK